MRTERPVDRLERRLAGPSADDDDAEVGTDGEESDTSLSRWLPEATAGGAGGWLATVRADPGRAGVVGLGVVGAIAVLVTVFTLMRDDTPPVTSAKLPPVQMVSSAAPSPGPGPPEGPVVVSVVGLVHRPGLVTLTAGARIADALSAAGGPLDGADLVGLNMARRVDDGEQIVVGISSPAAGAPGMRSSVTSPTTASPPAAAAGGKPSAPAGLVNLNTATVEQLDALPGVGPVTAAAIVAWRDANGRFAGVDQLGEVDGIGPARLEKLRALVEV
ncbi:ComEA family DNA-binding protein [Mycolicibacterium sp. 050158]|uniref:ComEA family DNA-binding protein n=1 Tax=Mycolicibacterium sp. 050158 TaxID=3090602 RepID=UPI00299D3722|nr:ComEA family DNA-binding protein [Mycolicibacterium sp. 050158]MDX1891325.1 ComEA family DNA-binding protein [Mycolicibacterium sp. 050158]